MADRRQRRLSAAQAPGAAATTDAALDSESRASDSDHMALRLWLRLLACTNSVDNSLPRFDLMAQLERHPGGMKMRELSRRLMVTGGNVTGLTDRLVAEGLVERQDDPSDRRAFTVRLTPAGQRQFKAMALAHEAWVAELLGGLPPQRQQLLFELLGELKRSLPADPDR